MTWLLAGLAVTATAVGGAVVYSVLAEYHVRHGGDPAALQPAHASAAKARGESSVPTLHTPA